MGDPREDEAAPRLPDVLLLDSLGELAGLYRLAAGAFIGGTLVPTGGHNPLEAACWGTPVAVGPSMENFRQIAEEFDREDAWARVGDARELATTWARWLDRPGRGRAARRTGQEPDRGQPGALPRTLEMLAELGDGTDRGE